MNGRIAGPAHLEAKPWRGDAPQVVGIFEKGEHRIEVAGNRLCALEDECGHRGRQMGEAWVLQQRFGRVSRDVVSHAELPGGVG